MIGYFRHQPSGCFWYRIKHPMELLSSHGLDVREILCETDMSIDYYDRIKSVQVYGIYPFKFKKAIEVMKADGKKIIYDIDDAMDLVDKTSPFYNAVQKDKDSAREMFSLADHITVATQALAEYARERTSAPVTVIPNCYDQKEWLFQRPKREGIRIGFAGAAPHITSLIKVLPAIRNLQKKYDIRFLIMGFSKNKFEQWVEEYKAQDSPEGTKAVEEFVECIKDIKFEWVPFVDFENYPATLTNMALDIGLCPLADTPFNRNRSASKAMEYTLSGALAIASDLGTFSQESAFLVNDSQWETAIETFINNPDERENIRQKHLDWLQENRTMESQFETLKNIYANM